MFMLKIVTASISIPFLGICKPASAVFLQSVCCVFGHNTVYRQLSPDYQLAHGLQTCRVYPTYLHRIQVSHKNQLRIYLNTISYIISTLLYYISHIHFTAEVKIFPLGKSKVNKFPLPQMLHLVLYLWYSAATGKVGTSHE